MGYLRNNLFVPLPQLSNLGAFNAKLLDKAMTLSDKPHWVKVDGAHPYSSAPALAERELICALGANTIGVYTDDGALICEHERQYGSAPTDSCSPASQLPLLCTRPGAWMNSKVRSSLPDELRSHMDSLAKADLKEELRIMRDQVAQSGWDAAKGAFAMALDATGRIDRASVAICAARINSPCVSYDDPVDLGIYDVAIGALEAR